MLELFEDAVRRAPDADLVRYFDTPVSVAQADRLSDALAVGFAAIGVAPGDRIAIHLQNQPQYLLALLGAWKAGAVAVACSPMLTEHELAFQLTDSGARVLVTLASLHEQVGAAAARAAAVETVITTSELDLLDGPPPALLAGASRRRPADTLDLLAIAAEHAGAAPAPVRCDPGDVAVLTYTSGTTGPPKGAMNTHANLAFAARAYRDLAALRPSDVVLGIAPLFHVTGLVAHIGVALALPAPLLLGFRFDAVETCRLIEAHRATFTVAAITAYLALLESGAAADHDLSSLTKAYTGGAPVAAAVAERFEASTGLRLHNVYGLTETTSGALAVPLGARAPVDPASGALSVGRPLPGTEVRVLDPVGDVLGDGEIGELAIHGPQVVPGYWGRPEETARAFPGGELLTGDVGLRDAQGWYFVVDRTKDLIIASGFKVWPRDVEDVLNGHPAVAEAAVVGVPDDYRGETVKAFVVLRDGAAAEPSELIAYARARLAAYKYPRLVEIVDALPRTASGKVLRRELRALSARGDAVAGDHSP